MHTAANTTTDEQIDAERKKGYISNVQRPSKEGITLNVPPL